MIIFQLAENVGINPIDLLNKYAGDWKLLKQGNISLVKGYFLG
jgi:hypothetical protein